ncbi:hypothetical protein I603_0522 [Erythrobacter dokdonensis DSW-74]|uniref:Uncharacterized protein n=1 Tax=Erythrobacter dokdonensis DSW-74 TaxID=1300349 RepID=A0A1A7BKZ2_9SPHN|nr:hypothetical protein I603_0522 [Erythrobacter dokdonensis DSW-74]
MSAVFARHQANSGDPFIDKPRILAGAKVPVAIDSAWKDIIVHRATTALKPCQKTGPGIRQYLELNGTARLLLHHKRPRSYLTATYDVADLHPHKVAAPELAIDCQVEQRTITQSAAFVEKESDLPDLFRLEGTLGTNTPSSVPGLAVDGGVLGVRYLHDCSPLTTMVIG